MKWIANPSENWTSSYKSQVFKIPLETLMELPSKCSVIALSLSMVLRRNKTALKVLCTCTVFESGSQTQQNCSETALERHWRGIRATKPLWNEVNHRYWADGPCYSAGGGIERRRCRRRQRHRTSWPSGADSAAGAHDPVAYIQTPWNINPPLSINRKWK